MTPRITRMETSSDFSSEFPLISTNSTVETLESEMCICTKRKWWMVIVADSHGVAVMRVMHHTVDLIQHLLESLMGIMVPSDYYFQQPSIQIPRETWSKEIAIADVKRQR